MNAYPVAEMGCAEQAELLTRTLGPLARESAAAITQRPITKKKCKKILNLS